MLTSAVLGTLSQNISILRSPRLVWSVTDISKELLVGTSRACMHRCLEKKLCKAEALSCGPLCLSTPHHKEGCARPSSGRSKQPAHLSPITGKRHPCLERDLQPLKSFYVKRPFWKECDNAIPTLMKLLLSSRLSTYALPGSPTPFAVRDQQ